MDDPRLGENTASLEYFEDWHRQVHQNKSQFISTQLYFDLRSMVTAFKQFCGILFEKFPQACIIAAYVNQDKSENMFGFIRGANGPNEMPNVLEYGEYRLDLQ